MLSKQLHIDLYKYLLMAIGITLPFHLHTNVVCIVLLTLNWILEGDFGNKFNALKKEKYFLLSSLFFLWFIIEFFITDQKHTGWFAVEKKAAFIILPLVLLSKKEIFKTFSSAFLNAFTWGVSSALLFCLVMAGMQFISDRQLSGLVYHSLAGHLNQSAIYLSLLCMLAATNLIYQIKNKSGSFKISLLILAYLILCIILLSSKLHIVLFFILAIILILPALKKQRILFFSGILIPAAIITLFVSTNNPLKKRFNDISIARLQTIQQAQFSPDFYFDGLTLRLVFMRFGFEILKEKNAWFLGVSPGNSQNDLNQKIKDYHLYTGDKKTGSMGYLNYEYHNQYMETLVGCGLIGLTLLLGLIGFLIKTAIKNKNRLLGAFIVIFTICFITESMLEMEIGAVSFSLFLCLLSINDPYKDHYIYV